ncbi:maleylpyruvate isomerase family mycothiol-dependent enzyme [Mycobacterium shimoidei]|uniref:maleylpyruvate isomerase family mycothiol-dependent enzyme n=1 Tax=Mycobacterium shimoidei TaxID=29313 RepID=UPI00084886E8|nr:maleylpyruvate isomerase family mycothiol-dependent enzyme [Mycobacterium shimoidei]MCV7258495.1 maleylpyruvate isomerase family mycothiol-dependent enzyme [Mycobacterium shimoidei]ODR12263.1 translation initiation factor 2 [Mycobacterium shimoidei]ORW78395.1 translation initiation factor 2 [Mycobacterium shimoidei]
MRRSEPDRESTFTALLEEYRLFANLVASLDDSALHQPTRCVGWQVCDVAAHVVGQASDVISGTAGTRTADEQAAALRDEQPSALAEQLLAARDSVGQLAAVLDDTSWAGPSPIPDFTVGQGVHALVNDAYVHADDIRAALGQAFDPGPGLDASLDFVLGALSRDDQSATDPRIARVIGIPATDFADVTGIAAHDFLLVGTGRLDPNGFGLPETVNIFR